MGVPYFFYWLKERYPFALQTLQLGEEPIIDNLYLDGNCIIHQFVKDEKLFFKDLISDKNFDDLFASFFNFLHQLIRTLDPQKMVFIALDGPAPRAKLNQQRCRRFQSETKNQNLNQMLEKFELKPSENQFLNNSISPGTDFMTQLNEYLKFFIKKKFQEDDLFRDLEIIFSGSDVAGEGEHKIISYIKQLVHQPNYNINTTHSIFSNDADLIMLSLQLHIQNITIIRQIQNKKFWVKKSSLSRKLEESQFEILHINIVREYFELEYSPLKPKMKSLEFNTEKLIDDFILLAFFIGNDFLPRLYCFDIKQGEYENVIDTYKSYIVGANSYLSCNGKINWSAFTVFLEQLKEMEATLIESRKDQIEKITRQNRNQKHQRGRTDNRFSALDDENHKAKQSKEQGEGKSGEQAELPPQKQAKEPSDEKAPSEKQMDAPLDDDICDDNLDDEQDEADTHNKATFDLAPEIETQQEFLSEMVYQYKQSQPSKAKEIYYKEKLSLDPQNPEHARQIQELVQHYLDGMEFVLAYYYNGIPSWSWYYPNYYSPLISDIYIFLKKNERKNHQFTLDSPFNPIKQLICILHPGNAVLLPKAYQSLIKDPGSPLRQPIDYYGNDYEVDPFGAIWPHMFIVKIPFLNIELIGKVFDSIDQSQLSPAEKQKLCFGSTLSFKWSKFKQDKQIVKSVLPQFYGDFEVNMTTQVINISDQINWSSELLRGDQIVLPSLHQKIIKSSQLLDHDRRLATKKMFLDIKDSFDMSAIDPKKTYYVNYPFYQKCKIIAEMNGNKIKVYPHSSSQYLKNYERQMQKVNVVHENIYQDLVKETYQNFLQQGISDAPLEWDTFRIALVHIYNGYTRASDGYFTENDNYYQELIVPLYLLSETCQTKEKFKIQNFKQLRDEFPIGCPAIAFQPDSWGHIGTVVSTKEPNVIMQINRQPIFFHKSQYQSFCKNNEKFYTLEFVLQELHIREEVLMAIISTIPVDIQSKKYDSTIMPEELDIGLNIINLRKNQLIPDLARIKEESLGMYYKYRSTKFRYLEFSQKLLDILKEYQNKFPEIFDVLDRKNLEQGKTRTFKLEQLFQKLKFDEALFKIIQIYTWIIMLDTSGLRFSGLSSKVINISQVRKIIEIIDQIKKKQIPEKYQLNLDPNFVFRYFKDKFIPLHFVKQPPYHDVADRVISVNGTRTGLLYFGMTGTITGIFDNKYEVVFDKPFLGGSRLGGRCPNFRGAIVNFQDLFNLDVWTDVLTYRNKKIRNWGWKIFPYAPEISFGTAAINEPSKPNQSQNKDQRQHKQQTKPKSQSSKTQASSQTQQNQQASNTIATTEKAQSQKLEEPLALQRTDQTNSSMKSDSQDRPINLEPSQSDTCSEQHQSGQQDISQQDSNLSNQPSYEAALNFAADQNQDQLFLQLLAEIQRQQQQAQINQKLIGLSEQFAQTTLNPQYQANYPETQLPQSFNSFQSSMSVQELELLQQQQQTGSQIQYIRSAEEPLQTGQSKDDIIDKLNQFQQNLNLRPALSEQPRSDQAQDEQEPYMQEQMGLQNFPQNLPYQPFMAPQGQTWAGQNPMAQQMGGMQGQPVFYQQPLLYPPNQAQYGPTGSYPGMIQQGYQPVQQNLDQGDGKSNKATKEPAESKKHKKNQ